MKKTKKLKQNWLRLKPEIKVVWILSLPAILTQITTIVMQYIDSAMVGALGANASATIGLVASSTWLFNGVTYAVSSGFSVQVAHRIGAGEEAEARNVVRHGLVAALIVSGLLSLLGVSISGQLPAWLGGEPGIRKDATLYFFVFALMLPFSQLNSLSSSFVQCSGDMECGDVSSGCGFQRDSDSTLWRSGSRYGNGPGLRCDQSHHDLALLHPQFPASAAPCGERPF